MTAAEKIDYSLIPVIEVAHELFGQESRDRSTGTEKHFPDHGGLFVNLKKNRWYSHGNGTGGDAISLIRFALDCEAKGAFDWLRSHGYESFLGERRQPKKIVKEYDYEDEHGARLYQVVRYEPKAFRQRRSDGNGGWIWKGPEKAVPYRLPELLQSDKGVLIVGGEKDVDNLRALGFTATCNHGGEGKWWSELTPHFTGRRVFLLLDNDHQGEKHLEVVGAALNGVAVEIRIVRFPELAEGGDVSDFIEQRRNDGLDDLAIKRELAERFRDAPARAEDNSLNSLNSQSESEPAQEQVEWPVMDEAAYYGLAGDVVRTIEPHSESDPVATLIQFLAAVGNIIGRKFYFQIERDKHHPNIFIILIGVSSKGRKGTSWSWVRSIAEMADKCWVSDKVKGGLSSGEDLINEVRDPLKKWIPSDQTEAIVDPGVIDKRLLVIEPEFASLLATMERHGSTLSWLRPKRR
jgi:hypothetical protein